MPLEDANALKGNAGPTANAKRHALSFPPSKMSVQVIPPRRHSLHVRLSFIRTRNSRLTLRCRGRCPNIQLSLLIHNAGVTLFPHAKDVLQEWAIATPTARLTQLGTIRSNQRQRYETGKD